MILQFFRKFLEVKHEQSWLGFDDDANVIAIAADYINKRQARKLVEVWLKSHFSGEQRYKRRIDKIEKVK